MKKFIAFILSIIIVISSIIIPSSAETKNSDEIHVLLLGTFHTRFMQYDVGQSLQQIASMQGKKVVYTSFSDPQSGMHQLDVLWNTYGSRIKSLFKTEYFDYVFLENWLYSESNGDTDDVKATEYEEYKTYTKKWADFAKSQGAQPILYIPQMWQYNYYPNLSEEDFTAYMEKHLNVAKELELPVVNAAKAWFDFEVTSSNKWLETNEDLFYYSSILYAERWHQNYIGGALTGMLMYEMLYNEKVENLPFNKLDSIFMNVGENNNRYLKLSTEEKQYYIDLMYTSAWDAYLWDYTSLFDVPKYDIQYVSAPAKNYTVKVKSKTIKYVAGSYNDNVEEYMLNITPIMKKLGYKYSCKKDKKKNPKEITFKTKKKTIKMTVGSKKFTVGKKKYTLPIAVKYKNKNICVPIKSFMKKIGYKTFKVTNIKQKLIEIK